MPINRSPPPTPIVSRTRLTPPSPSTSRSPLHPSTSEPNMMMLNTEQSTGADYDFANITQRSKRKRSDSRNEKDIVLSNFMSEIKAMFLEFKDQQNNKIEKIYESVKEIKLQNTQIQSSVTSLSDYYDNLKTQIDQLEIRLETERKNNLIYLKSLENKLEKLEQGARSTCVEIRNIPVNKAETKECLMNTVMKVGSLINAPVKTPEVKDIYRIGPTDSNNRTIIVDFVSNLQKEKFIHLFKEHNKVKNKLSTEHLHIGGPPKPIFVSENLSPKMKRLLFLAKDFASSNNYRYCWVTKGKIFLREKDGARHILVKDESDIPKTHKSE